MARYSFGYPMLPDAGVECGRCGTPLPPTRAAYWHDCNTGEVAGLPPGVIDGMTLPDRDRRWPRVDLVVAYGPPRPITGLRSYRGILPGVPGRGRPEAPAGVTVLGEVWMPPTGWLWRRLAKVQRRRDERRRRKAAEAEGTLVVDIRV